MLPSLVLVSVIPRLLLALSTLVPFLSALVDPIREGNFIPKGFPSPTTFEIKRSLHPIMLIRTQCQNRGYHTQCNRERMEATSPMDVDLPLSQVSPCLVENYLNLLLDIDEEEDIRRIATISQTLIISMPLIITQYQHNSHFYTIFRRISREINHSKVVVLLD